MFGRGGGKYGTCRSILVCWGECWSGSMGLGGAVAAISAQDVESVTRQDLSLPRWPWPLTHKLIICVFSLYIESDAPGRRTLYNNKVSVNTGSLWLYNVRLHFVQNSNRTSRV